MIIKIGQKVRIVTTSKDFEIIEIDVIITRILADVTDRGIDQSGIELLFVNYINHGITNDDYNQRITLCFSSPDTDYKWAYLYQVVP